MLRRHLSDPGGPEWLQAPAWPGLRWWTAPILNSMQLVIEARGRQGLRRQMTMLSVCTGTCAEGWAVAALGLPVTDIVTCDVDKKARDFVKTFHKSRVAHGFDSLGSFQRRAVVGDCGVHGKYCVVPYSERPDMFIGGPPCPPYSQMRHNRKEVPPELHPEFYTIFGAEGQTGYLQIVEYVKPRGGSNRVEPRLVVPTRDRSH